MKKWNLTLEVRVIKKYKNLEGETMDDVEALAIQMFKEAEPKLKINMDDTFATNFKVVANG